MLIAFELMLNHPYSEKWGFHDTLHSLLHLITNGSLQASEEHCFNSVEASFWTLEVH